MTNLVNKWEVLSQEMLEENETDEVFMKERIAPDRLRKAYEDGRAHIIEDNGRIIGYGALWDTDEPDWFELGSLWVRKKSRGHGLATEIYLKRLELVPAGSHCFIVSHNPKVVSLATKHGFTEATAKDWFILAPYKVVCGPCDRPVEDKLTCPHRAVPMECRLFVR